MQIKKYLDDKLGIPQEIPFELVNDLFKLSKEKYQQAVDNNEKFIVIDFWQDDNYEIQVCINEKPVYSNNSYLVIVYSKKSIFHPFGFPLNPVSRFPAVWDRRNKLDYSDYIMIQMSLNYYLKKGNLDGITINYDHVGRSCFFTKESLAEIEELIKQDKSFTVIEIFCDNAPEFVKNVRKVIGF